MARTDGGDEVVDDADRVGAAISNWLPNES
jgi:hypothetical protein